MKLSICTDVMGNLSFTEMLDKCVDLGVEGVVTRGVVGELGFEALLHPPIALAAEGACVAQRQRRWDLRLDRLAQVCPGAWRDINRDDLVKCAPAGQGHGEK